MLPLNINRNAAKSISFYTLGCRLNQSESAVIQKTFEDDGFRVVDFDQPADIVVINTCTVTENGDHDTKRLVSRINRLNPRAEIALIGCQAQIQKESLGRLANVRWVVGNAKKMDLVTILKEPRETTAPIVIAPTIPREPFTQPAFSVDKNHTRANLKIQDGCDFFCSFCEIPYARGRARSRVFSDLLADARAIVSAGHQEIVLTGINLGTYQNDEKKFLDVLDELNTIDGLKRIRISSIEPTTIPLEIIDRMTAGSSKLCRYLHIPLQSGSDEILGSMLRKYSTADFREFVEQFFDRVPGICVGTDVIVGFPGETDAHFAETHEFLRDLPLAYFHVFSYSERHYAKSQKLEGKVDEKKIQERSRILRELGARKRTLFNRQFLNTDQEILVEQKKDGVWEGLTDNYIRVRLASEEDLKNRFVTAQLREVQGPLVLAEPISYS